MQKSIEKVVKLGMAMGLIVTALNLPAQAEPPKISGFVDTTYTYNFQKPLSRISALRSFDRKTDTFLLNSAQVNIQGDKEGIGYYAELAFGTDGSIYGSTGLGSDGTSGAALAAPTAVTQNFELQEAFLTYKCDMTTLMFKAGKFATTQGIEVIESKDNFTMSRGFLFGLGEAFTHTGAMVGYGFGSVADLWIGAVNGWDTYTDNNTGKTLLAKLGLTPTDMIAGSVSILHGSEQTAATGGTNNTRTNIDTTWFIKPTSMFTLGLQALAGQEEAASARVGDISTPADGILDGTAYWYGAGIQPMVNLTDKFFVGARYEWFSDLEGARANVARGQILQNITIAPGVNLTENLMARVEYRYDWSSANGAGARAFENNQGVMNQNQQSTVGVEFIYKFGS